MRLKELKHKFIFLLLLLLISGCGSSRHDDIATKADNVKSGITTLSELEELLGDDYESEEISGIDYIQYKLDPDQVGSNVLSARLVFAVKDGIVQRYFVDKSMGCNEEAGIYCIHSRPGNATKLTLPGR